MLSTYIHISLFHLVPTGRGNFGVGILFPTTEVVGYDDLVLTGRKITLYLYFLYTEYPYYLISSPHTPRPKGDPPQGGNVGMAFNFL